MTRVRRLFRFGLRTRADVSADVREEIAFHLEARTAELVDEGWSGEDARAQARREFGDVDETAAYCRRLDTGRAQRMRIRTWATELWQDATYGARLLHTQPAHSAIALLTIAIGIAATTLVFSVVYTALLAPLPYADADRLMVVRLSLPDYGDLRTSTDVFEESGVFASNLYMLDDEQVLGGVVTPDFFGTLGVPPIVGRTFDARDGASPLVVLGHALWQRRFGGDPRVIGRTTVLSGAAYTIVGVMPANFQFPSRTFQLWTSMPFVMSLVPEQHQNRALRIFQAVGRLRPGLAQERAQAQLTALAQRLATTYPETNRGISLTLVSLHERIVEDVRTALLIALGSVACLLCIACANVASLTLARMTARTQELAVRAAIGAGRWRITRQLVTESLLTAACGGILGLLFARWGVSALPGLIADRIPRADEIQLSLPVLGVTVAAILATGLLVAAVPVIQLSVTQLGPVLKQGARGGEIRFGIRLRSLLVVAQIGLAVVVLAGALLLSRSLVRLLHADPGFAPERLLTFHLLLLQQPSPESRAALATRALDALAALPGVVSAGGATGLAPITAQRGTAFEVEGRADAPAEERRGYFIAASPRYFRALGTRLLEGREFDSRDIETALPVVIISETLARRFYPDGEAVGRRLRLVNPDYSDDWRTIVGVAADVRYQGLDDADPPTVYAPFAQTPFPWIYVHVRTQGDPMSRVEAIRRTVKSVDPHLTVANPQPMTALMAQSTADPRFRTALMSLFAGAAILLAAIGLYGVISFGVARRAREIAIRLALGATEASVRWRVLGHALRLAGAGVTAGLLAALWLGGVLDGMLYETAPHDPVSLVAVAGLLILTAILASLVPARRATRIQPVEALREE